MRVQEEGTREAIRKLSAQVAELQAHIARQDTMLAGYELELEETREALRRSELLLGFSSDSEKALRARVTDFVGTMRSIVDPLQAEITELRREVRLNQGRGVS